MLLIDIGTDGFKEPSIDCRIYHGTPKSNLNDGIAEEVAIDLGRTKGARHFSVLWVLWLKR